MKLLSCHIENYGKISNTDIKFDKNLTSFCEENGYGKTTISSFLKAMFYGLDTDRANSPFNERRHFCPFGGGKFGGYLLFESGGKTYKVERYFDALSAAHDDLTLYIDGKKVPAPASLGEQIFGIDRQSFERTISVSASEIEIASTGSIHTKLNNFVEGSDDDSNVEKAVKRLEEKLKIYGNSRDTGLITRQTRHVAKLTEEIDNAEIVEANLGEKRIRLEQTVRQIEQLNGVIANAQNSNLELNNWANYDRLTEEIAATEQIIEQIEVRYPHGVPTDGEIAAVNEAIEVDKTLRASGRQKLFANVDEERFSALHLRFVGGVPSEDELAEAERKIKECDGLSYEIAALERTETTPKEEKLRQRFVHHVPSKDELAELDKTAERYAQAASEIGDIPDYIADKTEQKAGTPNRSKKPYLLLAALAVVLLIAGIAVLVAVNVPVGAVMLGVGAVGLAAVGFIYLNNKVSTSVAVRGGVAENPQKAALRRRTEELANKIQAFIMPYGYTLSGGVAFSVATFKQDVNDYNELIAAVGERERRREEKLGQKQKLTRELSEFFARFRSTGDGFSKMLQDLRMDLNGYLSLKSRKELSAENESGLQEKIDNNRKTIVAFCRKYRLPVELIEEKIKVISADCNELTFARKTLKEQREKALRYREENKLTTRPDGTVVDMKELNDSLSRLQDAKNSLVTEITGDEYEVEKLYNLRAELDEANEKLGEYSRTYDILSKTVEALRQAERRLKDKYVKPIKDKFVHYASLLEKALGEKIILGADLDVRYEQGGKERSEKHLSGGQRSMCALCFRLALIDNMYSTEKPFLILDDPFAGFDEKHLEKVRTLIKDLSKSMQIIYFTCHPSRKI